VPFVLALLLIIAAFAILYFPTLHGDGRPSPRAVIDSVLAHPERRNQKAASMVRISQGSFGQSFNLPTERLELGMVTTHDDHRTIIVYYITSGSDQQTHSIQLIDTQSRTATWLMLDPAKMNDYFAAAAAQAAGPQH
jgi:hypothetical protein